MSRTLNQTLTTFLRAAPIVALALIAVASASPAAAQTHCASWADTLLDTTNNCVSEPWRPRASDVQTFRWNGHDYMVVHTGNEISIYNIDDPANPSHTSSSDFDFGTRGDSDYDLIDFDFCDDCRYPILSHKVERTVIFDLGGGSTPAFQRGAWADYNAVDKKIGGYVFKKGGQQYVMTASGPADCSGSALYTVGSPSSLGFVSCIGWGGLSSIVKGLETYDTGAAFYIFVGDQDGAAHIFRVDGVGSGVSLVHVGSPPGMSAKQFNLSIDRNNGLLASTNVDAGEIQIWDISDPENSVRLWTVPGDATNVSLRSPSVGAVPTMMVNRPGWPSSTRTFTIESSGPDEFEADFWTDGSLLHNDLPVCAFAAGGALSYDGSALYLSRYAIHQVFDLSDCLTPTPATANLVISPAEAFPGDTVEVLDTTTGRVDRWAVWVTEGSSPAGTPLPLGTSSTPSSLNPHAIDFPIPQDLAEGVEYWAHVEVESDDLVPTDPDFDKKITINRAPQATIAVTPSAVVVNESVTLTATAEGNPVGYAWIIDPPNSASFPRTGTSTVVPLDEAGLWGFQLTVDYQHGAGGGTYQATDEITGFNVTSVAADFSIAPPTPLHTQDIFLNGSISKPVDGNLSFQWTVEERGGTHTYNSCPASETCTIPGNSLNPATTYDVTLTVTNEDDSEIDQRIRSMFVGDGAINPSISFSPSNPEIGDNVIFTISGVPGDVDSATWNMGGPGCDGADSTPECVPNLYNNCKAQAFKYASGGTKSVHLDLDIGGNIFETDTSVTVATTGSCDGGGGPTQCDYLLGTTSIELDANPKNDKSVAVYTTSGCAWIPVTYREWITIVSPLTAVSGNGTFTFRVSENTGPYRSGTIIVGGEVLVVSQKAPDVEATFEMSNQRPEMGEVVTFSVDPILEVVSWNFGEENCKGSAPQINCGSLPSRACNTYQWTFPTNGSKAVTMIVTDGRSKTRTPFVVNSGQCCLADGRPDAGFETSADEIFAGETMYFTDTSSKANVNSKALSLSWLPSDPEIGDDITFTLSGVTGSIDKATWNFLEEGCEKPSIGVCEPHPIYGGSCASFTFAYASGGTKAVYVDLELAGGGTDSIGPVTVDIANSGTCDDGGGGGCSYSISPTSDSFGPAGGSGSFNVNTTAECAWDATEAVSWLAIDSGAGSGAGSVDYTVEANTGLSSRSGIIKVEGRSFRVTQTADQGDTAPTAWVWAVTRVEDENGDPVDQDVGTGIEQHFSHTFKEPGRYRVSMTATNCAGSTSTVDYILVEDAPIEEFVIGAAISQAGANDTFWETDLRFYNPCGELLDVRIEYLPENTDNAGAELFFREFQLLANETRTFADIIEAIPGLTNPVSGSVRIGSGSDSGCKVLSVSRTFNDTPDGSLGLFVPALPVKRVGREFLDVTGLIQNQDYRTNLRLVNYSDAEVWVPLTAYDKSGDPVGERRSVKVKGQSTKQLNAIAEWLGYDADLAPFSVRAEIEGLDIQAFGTVVDNMTGDSVLYLSSFHDENKIWLAGVASLQGVNDSQWRTDLWIFNPTQDWLPGEIEFVVGDDPTESYGFAWPNLDTQRTKQYLDIVSNQLGLEGTKGYIVLTGDDGGPAPQVSARTFNLDSNGGTYGLNLRAFGSKDLLQPGEVGYIAGISNSDDQAVGYRTNVGVLNTDRDGWTAIRITMYNLDGSQAAEPYETNIPPGKLRQFNIFKTLDLDDITMTGSLKIEALSGGAVAVYATEIDNRTQDSIFIPAQRLFMGLAR